ncbi:MAG: hypothetical protein AAGK05_17500 [Pseudomonadota bacterium]
MKYKTYARVVPEDKIAAMVSRLLCHLLPFVARLKESDATHETLSPGLLRLCEDKRAFPVFALVKREQLFPVR